MKHEEDNIQAAFFTWLRRYRKDLAEVAYAVPNGGYRKTKEGRRLIRQGVKSGVADVNISQPARGYHGLYIEFKYGDNSLSEEQEIFRKAVVKRGYRYAICFSAADAIQEVNYYLGDDSQAPKPSLEKVGKRKFLVKCRSMSQFYPTKQGGVGWLKRRGYRECVKTGEMQSSERYGVADQLVPLGTTR